MFKIIYHNDRSKDDSWCSLFEDAPSDVEGRYMSHFERKQFFDLLESGQPALAHRSVTFCYENGEVVDDSYRLAAKTWWENTLFIRKLMVAIADQCVKCADPHKKEPDELMSGVYFWAPFDLASAEFKERRHNGNIDDMGMFVQEAWRFVLTQASLGKGNYAELIEEVISYFGGPE